MLLSIDVGNTHTVIGVYAGQDLDQMWRVATDKQQTADEIRARLATLFFADGIDERSIDGACLASVVPRLTEAWSQALEGMFGISAVICNAQTAGSLFEADYPNPHEIGADRIADAVAARAQYGSPVIIMDFGTATNMEVIDAHGRFVGGVIAPGVETSAQALFSRATKLATIGLNDPGAAIGKNTEQAVQSGIVYGEADRVDGLVRRVFKELGYRAPVVATGGLSTMMAQYSSEITDVNPELTLIGLRLIYEEQKALSQSV